MIAELMKDIGLDFPGWLALILQLIGRGKAPAEAVKEAVAQRLPNMFGIGRTDEQLFEAIRQLVPATPINKRHLIDLVTGAMKDYEENIFRLTVAGMPCGGELSDDPVKNPQKGKSATAKKTVLWEFTATDLRVKYLEEIADEVSHRIAEGHSEKAAAALVVDDMRSRRLITRSEFAEKVHEIWSKASKWIEKNLFEFLGLDPKTATLDKIDEKLLVEGLKKATGIIENLRKKRRKGLESEKRNWRNVWGFGWFRTGGLLTLTIGLVLAIAGFIHNS